MFMTEEKAAVLTRVREIQTALADQGRTYDAEKLIALVSEYSEVLLCLFPRKSFVLL
jgi:hypothetical protein